MREGGNVTLASVGSFDSFNPFVVRGSPADGTGRLFDTLMVGDADEALTSYGHLAQTVEIAPDHLSVAFTLRPEAHFNDGTPVTAEDVAWTFKTLRDKGRPLYRTYYDDVSDVTVEGERRVVFHFKNANNHELPQILGELAVLPEHWWKGRGLLRRPDRAAAGQRAVPGRPRRYGPHDHLQARAELLGGQPADRARPEQFRHHPLRLFPRPDRLRSRRSRAARSTSGRKARPSNGPPATTSRRQAGAGEAGIHRAPPADRDAGLRDERPAGAVQGPPGARGVQPGVRLRMDEQEPVLRHYTRTDSYFSNSEFASSGIPRARS
ncbi:MAG: ABC transporter substrate-binding protein [Acetobacteraceae bacterium]